MRDLDIKLTAIDGDPQAALVEMFGTLDGTTTPRFDAAIQQLRSRGILRVILHMAGMRYVNSTGLGTLVRTADLLRTGEGGLALVQVPGKVAIVIEMSGLLNLLVTCDDVASALHALTTPGSRGHTDDSAVNPITQTGKWRSAAARLAGEDPELAQRRCRTAIERALTNLYEQRVGPSAGIEMNQILQMLQQQGLLPIKVFAMAYTVWELSDTGSTPLCEGQDSGSREAFISVACMTVLQKWFKQVYPQAWS